MISEYFEEVIDELVFNYGMNKTHILEYLEMFLSSFPVNLEDVDLVSECLEKVVSERSSIYKYYGANRPYLLRDSMKRAYEDVFGRRFGEGSNSLEATIREDEMLETLRLGTLCC